MAADWTQARRETLRALCDTVVAPVEPPDVEAHDPTGFWSRAASDIGVPARVAALLDAAPAEDREGMLKLLDLLRASGFRHLPQAGRERILRGLRSLSEDVAAGVDAYASITLSEFYGGVDSAGRNPNWDQLGYPGPPEIATPAPASLTTFEPDTSQGSAILDTDVCVVGSGSGGGVVAGVLASAGRNVVVLEAGGYLEGADLPPDELTAYRELYWRGGPQMTADGTVAMLAGATIGGGSTINWMNCVPPPARVRKEWADEHGLDGLADADFDAHLEAVLGRISATDRCSDRNGPNERLREGADTLGWDWHAASRNTDEGTYDPSTAGHVGFGDRTGSKQGTLATFLRDAVDHDARVVPRARVDRILVEHGRAAGVEATLERHGRQIPLTVRARHVVVAAGALETPALLLRSRIGGPAVGHHLRLHPVPVLAGFYAEPQHAWWGGPQTVVVDEFADLGDGHGYLLETPHVTSALAAASVPWRDAREHKLVMGRLGQQTTFIAVTRDHGSGQVMIGRDGEAVVEYPVSESDRTQMRHALQTMARLHEAAGAQTVIDFHPSMQVWRRGQDITAYAQRIASLPIGRRQRVSFSAHQMGTARMGSDPSTSVADPDGQLHDTPGVWVADTSAFPSAVGSNPMVTCMALARRTATRLLAID